MTNSSLGTFFTTSAYLRILWFTCWQAALSTLITLIVALPGAWLYGRYHFPGKTIVSALTTIPFVLPTVVTAIAFRALLGEGGLVNSLLVQFLNLKSPPILIDQTLWFFLLAHIFYNYALVLRIVGSYWAGIGKEVEEAAAILGASPRLVFFKITLPLLRPAITSATLLVFIFCFTSFGVILILGGPKYSTLEVEIYRQAIFLFNLPMAATLSLIQILMNFFLMWLHARLAQQPGLSWFDSSSSRQLNTPHLGRETVLLVGNLVFMALLLFLPLLALILSSFLGDRGWTLVYYKMLFNDSGNSLFFVPPLAAIKNSVLFGISTMGLSLVLGLCAALLIARPKKKTALWDAIIMLPLATSAVTLGFGYIITFNKPPLNLRDSALLIVLAHTLVAFPFVIRCLLPGLRRIPPILREAAAVLGASPWRIRWHIDIPLLAKSLLTAAVFGFAVSMGEFGATTFITRPQTPTLPIAIFRYLSRPGALNYGQALAMSVLLMLATGSAFIILEKLRFGGER